MTFRIIIDGSLCNGYGACVDADPADFAIGDDGLAIAVADRGRPRCGARGAASVPHGRHHRARRGGCRGPMSTERANVVIAGAGLAGARCAETLRASGCRGRIVMLGDEPHAPYERPALSKDVLTGARPGAALALRAPDFWESHRIEVRTGSPVQSLDVEARIATVAGVRMRFGHLVIATGLRARRLPAIPDGPGIHYLRTLQDAEALRRELVPGARLVIAGAGFVGLEVASSARAIGADVTVVDPGSTPFARTLGPEVGDWLGERARAAGVRLRMGRSVAGVERGADGHVWAVTLDDGSRCGCGLVVVGAGAIPNTELAGGQLALADDGGFESDAAGRTRVDGVYACGDVASVRRAGDAGSLRLEHWGAAASSARAVARAITGAPPAADGPPFFWSDQFGGRLQAVGLPAGVHAVEFEEDGASLVARYLDERGRLVGGAAFNRPQALAALRRELLGSPSPIPVLGA